MIKQSIRLVVCIIALFALILVFKHSHLMQEEKPLNTTERFNIAVLSTTISKERLVNELNALVDQYGAVLVKVVPNQDNYDSQKDIIWFGSLQPDGTSPRIRDNRISWLEPSVGGELIHSSDMGVRPLYGRKRCVNLILFVPDNSYCLVCNTREGQGFAITWRSPVAAYSF